MANKAVRMKVHGGWTIVDADDVEFLSQFAWYMSDGYVRLTVWNRDTKKYEYLRMHQLLLGYQPGMVIDHINRVKNDNRRSNLRFATPSQNWWNSERGDRILAKRQALAA